jgi:sigma-B regulation protein RsbU (phosphoserine phosphatase)
MKVLIVDDDTVTRLLLVATLRKLGYEPITARNGREAWQIFQNDTFPILISDWMMPELDGLELCRLVRAENRTRYTYIILLTMLGGKGCFLEGMRAGADDFITKPFDEDQLAARLHVAQRIVNLQREIKQLQGLLPICSYCKKIRDDREQWQQLEHYIASRTDAVFSHGICNECYARYVQPQLTALNNMPASPAADNKPAS